MLFLQRQGETIDDRSKNLQKLGNSIESFRLVDELEEDIVDGTSDERSQVQELAVDTVECGLEKVSLPRVFRVEQFQ